MMLLCCTVPLKSRRKSDRGGTSRDAGVTLASFGLSLVNNFAGRGVIRIMGGDEMSRRERGQDGQDLMRDRTWALRRRRLITG